MCRKLNKFEDKSKEVATPDVKKETVVECGATAKASINVQGEAKPRMKKLFLPMPKDSDVSCLYHVCKICILSLISNIER